MSACTLAVHSDHQSSLYLLIFLVKSTMKLETVTQALDILVPIAETIPAPVGTPLKATLDALSKITKYAQVCPFML
jgi:hypothetical protein